MNDKELTQALEGLFAYDIGSVDSGIHDEAVRARVVAQLRELFCCRSEGNELDEGTLLLSRFVRDHFLSEEALALGYSAEDVLNFLHWLAERMGWFDV